MILYANEGFDLYLIEARRVGGPLYGLKIAGNISRWNFYRISCLRVDREELASGEVEGVIMKGIAYQLYAAREVVQGQNQTMVLHGAFSRHHRGRCCGL